MTKRERAEWRAEKEHAVFWLEKAAAAGAMVAGFSLMLVFRDAGGWMLGVGAGLIGAGFYAAVPSVRPLLGSVVDRLPFLKEAKPELVERDGEG